VLHVINSELFCAVLCTAVVHNNTHTYVQFLKINVGLGLGLVFLGVCLGLAFHVFFGLAQIILFLVVLGLVSAVLCQEIGWEERL